MHQVVAAVLLVELVLCAAIVLHVPYTEIDWRAYMQEVAGFEAGERRYTRLGGDTGPLVYPAGFLYIFYLLKKATDDGRSIVTAQWIFVAIYLATTYLVLRVYQASASVPQWAWFLIILSKRVHSIFVLRCFNDCVAVLLGYLALLHFAKSKWRIACIFYSLSVSVKMNMLLYAPGILLVLLLGTSGIVETGICLTICAFVQLLVGSPFLFTFPIEYITRSFDLNRTFEYQWTVNLKFLSEEVFVSKKLSSILLLLTLATYTLFGRKWFRETWAAIQRKRGKATRLLGMDSSAYLVGIGSLSPSYIVITILTSNFIGIAFARTLHYQFYCWYWHSLPLLLWHAKIPTPLRLSIIAAIEIAFNVFPATAFSSLLLQLAHFILLLSLYMCPAPFAFPEHSPPKTQPAKSKSS